MESYIREMINDLLREKRKATKKSDIKYLDNYIHTLLVRERERERAWDEAEKELGYVVLNRGCLSDGDSFWEKRLYPGEAWNEEERREFIKDEWTYVHSPYDCSGEVFTWRISVFNGVNGVVAYIFKAIDC